MATGLAPTIPAFDVAGATYPAPETSGDYFDFIPLPHHRLGIALGDVEGHGSSIVRGSENTCNGRVSS
jgi:serine phosphatase RsbU (regulator of sigma subunit)